MSFVYAELKVDVSVEHNSGVIRDQTRIDTELAYITSSGTLNSSEAIAMKIIDIEKLMRYINSTFTNI